MADLLKTIAVPCTSCKITTDFLAPCAGISGGLTTDGYITNLCDIESYSDLGTDGIIDDITMTLTGVWYKVQVIRDSMALTTTVNETRGFKTYALSFQISAINDNTDVVAGYNETRQFMEFITNPNNKFVFIITNTEGIRVVLGIDSINGLRNASGTQQESGKVFDDFSGYTINLSGSSKNFGMALIDTYVIAPIF